MDAASDPQSGPSKRSAVEPEQAKVEGQVEAQPSEPADVPGEQAEEPWSEEEVTALRTMKSPKKRWSYQAIAKKLGRSEDSVKRKWFSLND